MSTFFEELESNVIFQISNKSCPVVIVGDFNIHFDSPTSPDTRKLRSLLEDHHLQQNISLPTHKHKHILDLVITPKQHMHILNNIKVEDKTISDHYLITIEIDIKKPSTIQQEKSSRDLRQLDTALFATKVKAALEHLDSISIEDINSTLKETLDNLAPVCDRQISMRTTAPWFTPAVKSAKRDRRKAERFWRKTGLTIHREIFIAKKKEVNETIISEKRHYFNTKFENVSTCKQLFQTTDMLLGKSKTSPLPSGNENEICELFSNFFIDKIDKIRTNLDCKACPPVFYDQFKGLSPLFAFTTLSNVQVLNFINKSLPKTCDLDPIPTHLFKSRECINVLLPYLTSIINRSLTTGVVPDCFKQAIVKPLLKKTGLDENTLKNFRPVSNLPFLSKVLEKIVLNQLLIHVDKNQLQEPYQSAYKANHSTETALLKVTSDILDATDNNQVCILMLLDLSSAFDTIDHKILLRRLEVTYGISGTVLRWLESYLSGRCQSVSVGKAMSPNRTLTCGVPQGSVLGPVLFTLYTQPLGVILKNKFDMNYHFYADDSQIYKTGMVTDIPTLISIFKACVDEVKIWMTSNKLHLNDEKTEIMLIKNPAVAKELPQFSIQINSNDIVFENVVKNLGVILDDDMLMSPFISNLCKNLYFQLRKIATIRNYLSDEVSKTLVTTLILSKLDYCNSLLFGLPKKLLNRLQLVQNHAARLICKKRKSCHITPLLKGLHWLPVEQRIEYKICSFIFKCLNNRAPNYLQDLLKIYTPARYLRSTDDKTVLVRPCRKYKYCGCRSFSYSGPLLWNRLPKEIREETSLDCFKRKLKHHLFCIAYPS